MSECCPTHLLLSVTCCCIIRNLAGGIYAPPGYMQRVEQKHQAQFTPSHICMYIQHLHKMSLKIWAMTYKSVSKSFCHILCPESYWRNFCFKHTPVRVSSGSSSFFRLAGGEEGPLLLSSSSLLSWSGCS